MRILLASWHRAVAGGAEHYLRALIPALAARGHAIALLHEHQFTGGVATVDPPDARLPMWSTDEVGAGAALEAAAGWRPDVAYVQGLRSSDLERALLDRFPAVLFAHGYYGTCATGTKRHAFPRIQECRRTFGPACLLLHYPRRCGGLDPMEALAHYRRQAARHALLGRYRAIVVASTHMQREYARHGIPADRLRIAPLPPPEMTPDATAPATRPLSGGIIFLGRLTADKGVDLLIDAIPAAERTLGRQFSLVVAGSGPELGSLQAHARARDVRAHFPGWVEHAAKLQLLREADLLAVPSVWGEPFGLVGIEAGCVGLPAVGFAVGGIPDWLTPGVSGELAPADPPTASGLAAAIARALADAGRHHALRLGAWETARRFSMEGHIAALEDVFARAGGAPAAHH